MTTRHLRRSAEPRSPMVKSWPAATSWFRRISAPSALTTKVEVATEDISRKIEGIQTDIKDAVDAIPSITSLIIEVNNISSTIATAIKDQNATTNEMSRNLSEAAAGSGEIVHNISGVAEAAQNTTRGPPDTQKAVVELARMATSLKELVARFKS
jgi:methyl-accepting chemotaxis protein